VEVFAEPVGTPFPRISGDGIEPKTIRGKGIGWAGFLVAVIGGVYPGKLALPDIAQVFPPGRSLSPHG
jgi:hypothetical protein